MIRYDLICGQGHAFDGWFANSAAYDRQADSSLISCPHCNSTEVQKAIMAPNLSGQTQRPAEQPTEPATYTAPVAPDPRLAAMIDLMRQIKAHVLSTSENVGPRFAEEARKMHYDEVEQRSIYGEATAEDANALVEEGIEIQALPRLPEDTN